MARAARAGPLVGGKRVVPMKPVHEVNNEIRAAGAVRTARRLEARARLDRVDWELSHGHREPCWHCRRLTVGYRSGSRIVRQFCGRGCRRGYAVSLRSQGMTLAEIGSQLGVSNQQASTLVRQGKRVPR